MGSAPFPVQTQKSWFGRHVVLTIVLMLGAFFVLGMLFIGGIVVFAMSAMKQSEVYVTAVERARQSPAVVEALGEPLEPAWYLSGNVNVSRSSGNADLAIPVRGPKGKGTIYAVGKKSAGRWTMRQLEVEVAGQEQRIDLLAGESPESEPAEQ